MRGVNPTSEGPRGAGSLRRGLDRWGVAALVFLMALLPRATQPVSRAMLWYERAIRFSNAVLSGDLGKTAVRHHPGVTVAWLSGFALQLFARTRGLNPGQLSGADPAGPGVMADAVRAGVLPLALTIALCIALSYVLIRRLAGARVAFAAAVLLALDPFYAARSQVLHLDALLATFMLVSALFLLNHLRRRRWHQLILSGVFGGLAVLTKSPALFLLPYTALAVGVYGLFAIDRGPGRRRWLRWSGVTARKVALWTLVAAVTFVAVWPAMWVMPLRVVDMMRRGITAKLDVAHNNPIFFNGRIIDPFEPVSPLFYVAVLGWKTTLVTLPMAGVAIVLAVLRLRSDRRSGSVVLLLAAFALFLTVQMSLGMRAEPRYVLPAFLSLDVAAGFGVVWTADAAATVLDRRRTRWVGMAVMGALLALQAARVIPRHPHYGTVHNGLLGGARRARHVMPLQTEGEGVDLAARYLNALPDADGLTVGVDYNVASLFGRTFVGRTTAIDDPEADYRVYGINQVTRQLHVDAWGQLFALDRRSDPAFEVAFGGVPYVRVYRNGIDTTGTTGPTYEMGVRLGDQIRLERVRLNAETVIPGRSLVVRPTWTVDGPVDGSYKVFCHLLSADGELLAQRDDFPLGGARPTSTWQPGETIEDRYAIELDRDAAPGRYELSIGMYDPESMARVAAHTADEERLRNDRIVVGEVVVADIGW